MFRSRNLSFNEKSIIPNVVTMFAIQSDMQTSLNRHAVEARHREQEKENLIAESFNSRQMSSLKRQKQLNREFCSFYSKVLRQLTIDIVLKCTNFCINKIKNNEQ